MVEHGILGSMLSPSMVDFLQHWLNRMQKRFQKRVEVNELHFSGLQETDKANIHSVGVEVDIGGKSERTC